MPTSTEGLRSILGAEAFCMIDQGPSHGQYSNLFFLRQCQGVFSADAQTSHGVFDLRMPKQNLDRSYVSCGFVDDGSLGLTK